MRLQLIIFLVLTSLQIASAQDKINVHVRQNETGEALELIYVNVYNDQRRLLNTAVTNEQGNAVVIVRQYPATIEVVGIGYDKETLTLDSTTQGVITFSLNKRFSSINEVVVTGTARPLRPGDASAVYKTISAATMRAQGAINLEEALSRQVNMDVTSDPVLGTTFSMQGLKGDKSKILIDGMPLNGREGGNLDMGQVNMYNVDRLEIVQGPMSVVYGSDALGGVINVITKDRRKPWDAEANFNYESVGKYNVNVTGSKSWKRHSFSLGGGRNYFQGWKYLDTIEPHREMLFKPKEQYFGNFNYSYVAPSGFKARLASDFLREKVTFKGAATISPFYGYSLDQYFYNTRSTTRLLLEDNTGKQGHWQMMNGYSYYHRTRNTYRKDLVTLQQDLTPLKTDQDTTTFNEYNFRGSYDNKFKSIGYTIGYDLDLQDGNSQKISEGLKNINDYAVFGMVKLPLIEDQLNAEVGVRLSNNTVYKTPVIPSLNILYKANEKLNIRASYAKGFRAPSLKELYLDFVDQNHDIHGNQNLAAEDGDHIQASTSYMIYENQADYAQLMVTGFYNNVTNEINLAKLNPDPNDIKYMYANVLHDENVIGTTELEGQTGDFHYRLAYSYRRTFAQATYDAFNVHEVTTNLQYFWSKPKLNISLFNKFTGAQPSSQVMIDGSVDFNGRQDGYDMLDFSLQRKFFKNRIEITAGIKNLLDVQTLSRTGVVTSSAHSSTEGGFLPRRLFTTLRVYLD